MSNARQHAGSHGLRPYNRRMPNEPIYRLSEIRALEASAARLPLMQRAGLAAAEVARELLRAA